MLRCPPLLTLMLLATSGLVLADGRDEVMPRTQAQLAGELTAMPAPVSSPRADVRAAVQLRSADALRPSHPATLNRWSDRRVPGTITVRRPGAEPHPFGRVSAAVGPAPAIRPGSFATVERRILFRNQLATMTPGREGTLNQP